MRKTNKAKVDRDWIRAAQDFGGKDYLRGYDAEPMQLVAAGENDQKLPIVSGIAYSGGDLNVGMTYPVILDLATTTLISQAIPLHREHDTDRIVGHTVTIDLAAKNIKFTGVLSGVREDAQEVKETAKNGFPWRPSIGASRDRLEFLPDGQTTKVNGRTARGPRYIARGVVLREVSLVTVAGDDKSEAAIAAKLQESQMNPFEKWVQAKGFDPATITDEQKKFLQASFKAEQEALELEEEEDEEIITAAYGKKKPKAKPAAIATIDENKLYANFEGRFLQTQARVSDIRAAFGGNYPEEEAKAILDSTYTKEKAELFVLRASRPKAPSVSGDQPDFKVTNLHCAMARNAGVSEKTLVARFGKDAVDATSGSKWNGFGVQAMLDTQMVLAGFSWSGSRKSDDFLHRAREAEVRLKASGFATTSLSNALQATVYALLMDSYGAIESTWRHFCGVRSHSDFKINKYYRLDATGSVREVGADGQLPSLSLSASEYTNQLKTYGGTLTLTRQDKINDDLGMMGQLPKIIGRSFVIRLEEAVYKALLALFAGGTFFTTAKGNKITGAGSALSYPALSASLTKFKQMKDANKKPILARASRILVPSTLEQTASDYYTSERIVLAGVTDTKAGDVNGHKGRYLPESSLYLDDTAVQDQDGKTLTGQSSTRWLMHGDPNAGPAPVYVAFLNGNELPTIREAITPADILGDALQFFHDWGVGAGDEYSAVENVGA